MSKINVGIVFGGRSGEHEVSLASAQSVINAIDKEKYNVVPIGIDKDGQWIAGNDPMRALTSGAVAGSEPVALLADPTHRGLVRLQEREQALATIKLTELNVVFPVLHGTYGEDGTVQGLFELAGVPYVGAGIIGSVLGLDKAAFKDVMKAQSLPIVKHLVIKRRLWRATPEKVLAQVETQIGYPVFTKPANLGSSVGITKCHNRSELRDGLSDAARYDRKLIVEEAVPKAREIEVSVLGNDDPIASVPGEVIPSREFYSYEAKYLDEGEQASRLLIPAPLGNRMTERIREMALQVYLAIDCAGMARVDFLLSDETGTLYVNEVNTIPGFTKISMYPKLWEATGISYTELIDRLIELAVERFEDKNQSETRYNAQGD